MKKTILLLLCAVFTLSALTACGGNAEPAAEAAPAAAPAEEAAAPAAEVTWADYIDWLAETFGANSPNPDDYRAMLERAQSWDDVDPSAAPWDKILAEDGFNASTFEEFVAAGGVGTYNEDFQDSALTGSGEPTGEPSAEPAA